MKIWDYDAGAFIFTACNTGVACDTALHNWTIFRNESSEDWGAWLDDDFMECSGSSTSTLSFIDINNQCDAACVDSETRGFMNFNFTDVSPPVGDDCDYTSGLWQIDDDCTIDTDTDVDAGEDINITGVVINDAVVTNDGAITNRGTFTNQGSVN